MSGIGFSALTCLAECLKRLSLTPNTTYEAPRPTFNLMSSGRRQELRRRFITWRATFDYLPTKRGGAGLMHWSSHVIAFKLQGVNVEMNFLSRLNNARPRLHAELGVGFRFGSQNEVKVKIDGEDSPFR